MLREDEYKIDGGVLIDDLNDELGLKSKRKIMIHCRDILLKNWGIFPRKEDRDIIETVCPILENRRK